MLDSLLLRGNRRRFDICITRLVIAMHLSGKGGRCAHEAFNRAQLGQGRIVG